MVQSTFCNAISLKQKLHSLCFWYVAHSEMYSPNSSLIIGNMIDMKNMPEVGKIINANYVRKGFDRSWV